VAATAATATATAGAAGAKSSLNGTALSSNLACLSCLQRVRPNGIASSLEPER